MNARRSIAAAIIDARCADDCEPCPECDGNPNCSNCGGGGFLSGSDGEWIPVYRTVQNVIEGAVSVGAQSRKAA